MVYIFLLNYLEIGTMFFRIFYIFCWYILFIFFSKVVKRRNFVGSTKTLRNDRKKRKEKGNPFLNYKQGQMKGIL